MAPTSTKKSGLCPWHLSIRRMFVVLLVLSALVFCNLLSPRSLTTVSLKRKDSMVTYRHNQTAIDTDKLNVTSQDITSRALTSLLNANHLTMSETASSNATVSSEKLASLVPVLRLANVTEISRNIPEVSNVVVGKFNTDANAASVTPAYMETDQPAHGTLNKYGNYENSVNSTHRRNSCNHCFKHTFKYVIENDDICKLSSPTDVIDLVVLIMTSHRNYQARNAIRSTWLLSSKNNTANIRYVFLLGETRDERYREQVLQENEQFQDIVKEDFVDSYVNLTYKTIMGFKWVDTKCGHARFVMKTDDDMFVNVPAVMQMIKNNGTMLQNSIGGACSQKASPIRNRRSKWYASFASYPDKFYPGFCSGTGYLTSSNVVRRVYRVSSTVPFFHLEDVYVALCIKKLGFKLVRFPGFHTDRPRLDACEYKGSVLKTAHRLSPLMLKMIWNRKCIPGRYAVHYRRRFQHVGRSH